MERYKFSQYNIVKTTGCDTWVFNTLTAGFIKLPTEFWLSVNRQAADNSGIDADKAPAALVQAGIMVRSEVNELQLYKYLYYNDIFNSSYFNLSIAPTMKCNFCCFYCFEGNHKVAGTMSEEVEENLVKFICLHKDKPIGITWFGGEPLLAFDKITSICEKLNKNGVKFISDIITNGSLFTESVINRLKPLHLSSIQISLDGLAADHDKRRIFKNGAPSFSLIVNNIEKLLHLTDITVSVKVTNDNTNKTAYGDIKRFISERFGEYVESKRILVSQNFVQNRTDFDKCGNCFNADTILKERIKSFESKSEVCGTPLLLGLAMPCMYRRKMMFAVDSQGCVYRCLEHLGVPSAKIGDLRTGRLSSIKLAETTFQNNPFEDAECTACAYFPVCGGGCPVDRQKRSEGKKINCCSMYKDNLAELLPYFYKYQYRKAE